MHLRILTSLLLLCALAACSSTKPSRGLAGAERRDYRGAPAGEHEAGPVRPPDPWQLWEYGTLIDGSPARDKGLAEADALHRRGDLQKALAAYRQLAKRKLGARERESVALRIASTQLSLGAPKEALAAVSAAFKDGGDVATVPPPLTVVLAYAYARDGDLNQGLAWFAEYERKAGAGGPHPDAAREGVRRVLRGASKESFDALSPAWEKEPWIAMLIGEERKLRARGVPPGELAEVSGIPSAPEPSAQAAAESLAGTPMKIGILLPLSGEYAAIGKSTRDGIALAVSGNNPQNLIQLVEKDTASGMDGVEEAVASLVSSEGVQAIIGPLLSTQAPVAAEAARMRNIPLITFSKNANFVPGQGVYRLGPTSRSQVEALLDVAVGTAGMSRFAVVYPDTQIGIEFADAFKEGLRRRELTAVFDKSYSAGADSALMSLAEEVASAEPEAIFFPDSLSNAARFFMSIPEPSRSRISPLGTAAWDEGRQLKQVATALENAIFPSVFFAQSTDPSVQQFIESYRGKFNTAPDLLAAQGMIGRSADGKSVVAPGPQFEKRVCHGTFHATDV